MKPADKDALIAIARMWDRAMLRLAEQRDRSPSEMARAYYSGLIQGLEACCGDLRETVQRIESTTRARARRRVAVLHQAERLVADAERMRRERESEDAN
jgi:hypothetical protein